MNTYIKCQSTITFHVTNVNVSSAPHFSLASEQQ